jgi:predicted transcriptional regulator
MKGDINIPLRLVGRVPRPKENAFNLRELSMREFEAFIILLTYEGEEQSTLKKFIDLEFDHKSQTKGYDYINNLCKKGFAYKKKTAIKGKQITRIYVRTTIRKKYEKFMLPTISSVNESLEDAIKDYMDGMKEEKKIREKFRTYTEALILSVNNLITKTPTKTLSSQRFQKKVYDTIWKYYRAEILKYEVFSK